MIKYTFIKLLKILLILIFITSVSFNTSNAGIWDDIIDGGDSFVETGEGEAAGAIDDDSISDVSSAIYNVLFTIGIILIVIVGVILGIQFMVASAGDKAKIKESLIPYVVGSVVILGAFGIWKLCIIVFSQI